MGICNGTAQKRNSILKTNENQTTDRVLETFNQEKLIESDY